MTMNKPPLHPWTLDPDEAMQLQGHLRQQLLLVWDVREITTIGGVDVACIGDIARAAIAILTYPTMDSLDSVTADQPLTFPYIPGLLAFRVGPAILAAWEKITDKPDVLLVHGHGTAHPGGFGLASHLGLWLDTATIGVARSRLYGIHGVVGAKMGDWSKLQDESNPNQIIGAALRTCENAKPIYTSPGHRIDLRHSLDLILACCRDYRMPEPIRRAHMIAVK